MILEKIKCNACNKHLTPTIIGIEYYTENERDKIYWHLCIKCEKLRKEVASIFNLDIRDFSLLYKHLKKEIKNEFKKNKRT